MRRRRIDDGSDVHAIEEPQRRSGRGGLAILVDGLALDRCIGEFDHAAESRDPEFVAHQIHPSRRDAQFGAAPARQHARVAHVGHVDLHDRVVGKDHEQAAATQGEVDGRTRCATGRELDVADDGAALRVKHEGAVGEGLVPVRAHDEQRTVGTAERADHAHRSRGGGEFGLRLIHDRGAGGRAAATGDVQEGQRGKHARGQRLENGAPNEECHGR